VSSIVRCVRKIAKRIYYIRHVCPSVRMDTGRISMKFNIRVFFRKSVQKIKSWWLVDRAS